MLIFRLAIVLATLGLTAYAVFDVLRTPTSKVSGAIKMLWLAIAALVPVLGPMIWLLFGRPAKEGSLFAPQPRRSVAPDDSPEFLARLEDEIRRRRRTEQLRRSGELDPEVRRGLDDEIERLEEELRQQSDGDEDPDSR